MNGFTAGRALGLIAVHLTIGLTGLFALPRSAAAHG
jgi:hypothetical protein